MHAGRRQGREDEVAELDDPAVDGAAHAPRTPAAGRPGRPTLATWLALGGAAWSLLTVPVVAAGWSWSVFDTITAAEPYRSLTDALDDPYVTVGALGGLSFLAIGLAVLLGLRPAGWGSTALAVVTLAGAVVCPVSYLGTPDDSPLHVFWGAEAWVLLAMAAAGVAAAVTAGPTWRRWARVLVGCTVLVLGVGMALAGYYPHGCLITFGVVVALLVRRGRTA